MEYDKYSFCKSKLILNSGRELIADNFLQFRTYAFELEPLPSDDTNQAILADIQAYARTVPGSRGEPLLLTPESKRDRVRSGDTQGTIEEHQSRNRDGKIVDPKWMPAIYCIICFVSNEPVSNQDMYFSALTAIWFQNEFGIDENAMNRLKQIDWDKYAIDFNY